MFNGHFLPGLGRGAQMKIYINVKMLLTINISNQDLALIFEMKKITLSRA